MAELKCRRRNGAGVLQKLRGEYILHHWTGPLRSAMSAMSARASYGRLWLAMVGYGWLVVDAF